MKILTVLTALLLACSCVREHASFRDDFFYLRNDGAFMPVFVKGNTDSRVFVIYLHGGPGSSTLQGFQNNRSPLTRLQSDFSVVYWDQRCAGQSSGNCDSLSLEDYTEDLEQLIQLLKHKYTDHISIFLMGHSWGGSLGINFLSNSQNQRNIKGWIEVGGGHNVPSIVHHEREMIVKVGLRMINHGVRPEQWRNLIESATVLDLSIDDDMLEMNRIASEAEQLVRDMDSVNEKIHNSGFSDYFFGPIDFTWANQNLESSSELLKDELLQMDLSPHLPSIQIPTLLLWGAYDFRVPPSFAQEALSKYGSPNKELIIFRRSAHYVHFNEPELFFDHAHRFISTYK